MTRAGIEKHGPAVCVPPGSKAPAGLWKVRGRFPYGSPGRCIYCVWTATNLYEGTAKGNSGSKSSTRSFFDVNFSKRLFGLCRRHFLLIESHKFGNARTFGCGFYIEPIGLHYSAVIILMCFS